MCGDPTVTSVHCEAIQCKYNSAGSCWAYDIYMKRIDPKLYDVLAVDCKDSIPVFRCERYEKKG